MTDKELKAKALKVIFRCNKISQLPMAKRYCHLAAVKLFPRDINNMSDFYNDLITHRKIQILKDRENMTDFYDELIAHHKIQILEEISNG